MWMVRQKRMSDGEYLRSHSVVFPRISVIERTSKDVCSAHWLVCSHSPCVDARQFLMNLSGKHIKFADKCSFGICVRNFILIQYILQKRPIILKNTSNKSCTELNFLQETQWTHISIYSRSGAGDSKDCIFEIF